MRLITHRNDYTFDGVEYSPLMCKVIMHLATIELIATTQTPQDNLQNLGVYTATVSGNIDMINSEFDQNYSQIITRGATVDNPISIIFEAYSVVPCYYFTTYMKCQHVNYLEEKLSGITQEVLMASSKAKFGYLKLKEKWGAKSPKNKKIVAMAAKIRTLKGQLKLDPKLSAVANEGQKRRKRATKARKRTRRTRPKRKNKRGISHGRKCHLRRTKRRKNRSQSTLTIGASTTWRVLSTSLRIENLRRSTRTIGRRDITRLTLLLLPLQPPLPSTLVMRPSWLLLVTWMRTNDGLRQHAFTI